MKPFRGSGPVSKPVRSLELNSRPFPLRRFSFELERSCRHLAEYFRIWPIQKFSAVYGSFWQYMVNLGNRRRWETVFFNILLKKTILAY